MRISFKTQLLLDHEELTETINEINRQLEDEQYKMSAAQIALWKARKHNFIKARSKISNTIARL